MSHILNADHLEEQERRYIEALENGEDLPAESQVTFADVVESGRRIRYFEGRKAEIIKQAEELIAPLLAEIQRIEAWRDGEIKPLDGRIEYHQSRIIAYARLNPPAKGKTIKFPGGSVSARMTRGKFAFMDERATAFRMEVFAPQYVRSKPEIDKQALYDALDAGKVRVEGEQVYIITEDGEKVLLEGAKWEQPQEQYTVKVEEG